MTAWSADGDVFCRGRRAGVRRGVAAGRRAGHQRDPQEPEGDAFYLSFDPGAWLGAEHRHFGAATGSGWSAPAARPGDRWPGVAAGLEPDAPALRHARSSRSPATGIRGPASRTQRGAMIRVIEDIRPGPSASEASGRSPTRTTRPCSLPALKQALEQGEVRLLYVLPGGDVPIMSEAVGRHEAVGGHRHRRGWKRCAIVTGEELAGERHQGVRLDDTRRGVPRSSRRRRGRRQGVAGRGGRRLIADRVLAPPGRVAPWSCASSPNSPAGATYDDLVTGGEGGGGPRRWGVLPV